MAEMISTGSHNLYIDRHPDECPLCRNSITPISIHFKFHAAVTDHHPLQGVYSCPSTKCGRIFIASFTDDRAATKNRFSLSMTAPVSPKKHAFSEEVKALSSNFASIYNEAYAAEQRGLLQVCGCGYRKSLEFLIKDYLVSQAQGDEPTIAKIKATFLGTCIKDFIKNDNIKTVAERATWLGNDETHYVRTWADKDLQDLKKLISMTVHWIEHEVATEQLKISMPARTKP